MAEESDVNDAHDTSNGVVKVTFASHDPHPSIPARPLNDWERALIERILSIPFEGQEAAQAQASSARVEWERWHCPTVWLQVDDPGANLIREGGRPFQGVAPCEIRGQDVDGMPYEILLHIDHGVLTELDMFRGDGQSFVQLPGSEAVLICR